MDKITAWKNLRRRFEDYDDEYRPVPWWSWNGDMQEAEMQSQLLDMHQKGIREIIIFPLYGLETEYLSKAWWDKISFTLQKAVTIGLKVWIYDEYNWPSGTAAGKVIKDHQEFRETGLQCKWRRIAPGESAEFEIAGKLAAMLTVLSSGAVNNVTAASNITPNKVAWKNTFSETCRILCVSIEVNEKIYQAGYGIEKWNLQQPGSLDVMNPEAVRTFLEYTHEEYLERFGKYFGNVIPAFFTDEPQFHYSLGTDSCYLPYTPDIFTSFREKYGYELLEKLPEIIFAIGNYEKIRNDYWGLVSELITGSFHRQVSKWCEQNKVAYTGHLMHEESLSHLAKGGSINACLKWMHIPGMDLLGKATGFRKDPLRSARLRPGRFNFTAKMVSSVATHYHRERTICEAFGVAGYDISFADFKKITDWLTATGINTVNFNNIPYSAKSYRKLEDPALTAPWWKYFKYYSDYASRLGMMCTAGNSANQIAVLYPESSARAKFSPANPGNEDFQNLENVLLYVSEALLRTHWDFDFIFEELLDKAQVKDGKLELSGQSYAAVILPGVSLLPDACLEKLREFAASGGRIIHIGTGKKMFKLQPEEVFLSADRNYRDFESDIDLVLRNILHKELDITGKDAREIVSSIKKYADGKCCFLANQTDEKLSAEIKLRDCKKPECWDPDTGKRFRVELNNSQFILEFAPGQALFLVDAPFPQRTPEFQKLPEANLKQLGAHWQFTTSSPNTFSLNLCSKLDTMNSGNREEWHKRKDDFFDYSAKTDRQFDKFGQLVMRPLASIESPSGAIWIRSTFRLDHNLKSNLKLVLDSPAWREVYVNGKRLTDFKQYKLWSYENIAFDLSGKLLPGTNSVTVKLPVLPEHNDKFYEIIKYGQPTLDPIVICGRFAVEDDILKPEAGKIGCGSWHLQGYPNYSGTGIYRRNLKISKINDRRFFLELEQVAGILEVEVNDSPAETRCWEPYRIEITDLLRAGNNLLTLNVTNTLANLIAEPVESGLLAPVKLLSYPVKNTKKKTVLFETADIC